jgi:hypothetical protein
LRFTAGIFCAVVLVAACSSTPAAPPEPTAAPTPAPTPAPWSLTVPSAVYTRQVLVGDTIEVTVKVKNSGRGASHTTLVNFSELDKYADLFDCKPECQTEDLPGFGPSAILPGVTAGKTQVFIVNFVANKVGAVKWSLCVYDDNEMQNQVWCGDATTAIR